MSLRRGLEQYCIIGATPRILKGGAVSTTPESGSKYGLPKSEPVPMLSSMSEKIWSATISIVCLATCTNKPFELNGPLL